MKKPRTIALLVLLLALVGTTAVLCGIQDTMRHAAVTETTLFGDASAAEGVELCFGGTSDSKLSWEHRWRFGGSGTLDPAETDADRAQQNALHVQSTSVYLRKSAGAGSGHTRMAGSQGLRGHRIAQ